MREDLLPPNSTALEQTISRACAPGILNLGDAGIRGRKFDPPDNWLDPLIYEYALGEISPWFADKRELIAQGVKWARLRGTPSALHLAFSWIGMTAAIEEERPDPAHPDNAQGLEGSTPVRHFAGYQIHPQQPIDSATLCQLVHLSLLSQPVRARLSRLYHGYDVRRLILSEGELDHHLLSADSGVRPSREQMPCLPWADGYIPPLLSFGQIFAAHVIVPEALVQGSVSIHMARRLDAREADMPILDDLPEPREVETAILTEGQTGSHAIYHGQLWTGTNWASADSWVSTRTIITGSTT